MTDDSFDYGAKNDDGQYERHPTIEEGEFVQPVRKVYRHEACGKTTRMVDDIAESVARDPVYYGKTFCCHCGEYVPVDDVSWARDGTDWEIPDEAIEDWMEGGDV